TELGQGWFDLLCSSPRLVVDWLVRARVSVERLSVALRVLEPQDEAVRALSASRWSELSGSLLEGLPESVRVRGNAFLLSIAFARNTDDAAPLVAVTYSAVYEAARTDSLPYAYWRWLEDELPQSGWWRAWDR